MNGIRRSRRIGNGLPIPLSRLGKRLGSAGHLMGRGVRRDFEIHGAIRGSRRMPIERIERRKNVRRRIGEPVVQIDSNGRSERVSLSGRIRAYGRNGRAAGKIETVSAGTVRSDEPLRPPGSGRGIRLSESFGAEGLSVYEVDGGEVAVVVYGSESSDHVGKRGRIPIRCQSRARMGPRERNRNTFSVHVDSGTVGGSGVIGVPRDDDVVKRRRIAVRRSARVGVIGIPREKQLVGRIESEFRGRSSARKSSEKILQDAELSALRPKTHGPCRQIPSGGRSFAQVSASYGLETDGVSYGIRGSGSRRSARHGNGGRVYERSRRRGLGGIAYQAE